MRREPTRRSARPSVRKPRRVYWRDVVRIGVGRATSRFEDGNDSDHRVTSTVEAKSVGVIGSPGGRNWVTNRAPATTPRAAPESPSSRGNFTCKRATFNRRQARKLLRKHFCLQTFLARFENYSEYFEWNEADKLFQLRASLRASRQPSWRRWTTRHCECAF